MCCMTPRREEGHEEEGSTAEVQVGVWPPADCLDGRVKPVEKQVKFIGTLSLPVCSCVSAPPLSWTPLEDVVPASNSSLSPVLKNPLILIIFVFFFIIMGPQICNCLWLKITKWKHVNRRSVSWPSLKVQNVDQREEIRAHGKVPRKKWVNSMKKHHQFKPGLKPVIYVPYSKSDSHQPLCDPWQKQKKSVCFKISDKRVWRSCSSWKSWIRHGF